MLAAMVIRVSTLAIHSTMGGAAIFCLIYACLASDFDLVRYLVLEALKWGGLATVVVYFEGKYLH
jgi:hypothetical protein